MRFVPILLLAACGRCSFDGDHQPDALPVCTPQAIVNDIKLGADFACAQLADRTLRCWGDGSEGQLGTGDFAGSEMPVAPLGLGAVDSFALGVAHACAVAAGNVYCWGRNHTGQIGNNGNLAAPQPVRINTPPNVVAVAAGGMNTCAITQGGELWCWGQEHGTAAGTIRIPTRVTVPPVKAVALGQNTYVFSATHGCAVTMDGNVWCFGSNDTLQLGVTTPAATDAPLQASFTGADAIVAGDYFTCARTPAGEVFCWGLGVFGRLGDGTMTARADAQRVVGLADVAELSAHRDSICARTTGGEVYCWGSNYHHQIPGHAGVVATTPVKLPFVAARSLGVSQETACVIEGDTVYCWGDHRFDRPGQVRTSSVAATRGGSALTGVTELRANSARTCALHTDGLLCWGEGSLGQHGDGSRDDRAAAEGPIADVTAFALGTRHMCAARANGTVACWGEDDAAQVGGTGAPTFEPTLSPRTVPGIGESIVELAAGDSHTCARGSSNDLWCWGNNSEGQTAGGMDPTPVIRSNFTASARITAGNNHTCALELGTTALTCSGRNNEFQIDSMISDAALPRPVLPSATVVTAQGNYSCALVATDAVCWGDNTYGQLGDGTYTNNAMPRVVLAGDVVDVTAGNRHACALTSGGATWCWGANDSGQLGDGTLISTKMPVRAPQLDGVTQLALGARHTCGLNSDGTVRCVGSDQRGQLGDGGTRVPATPTPAAISCP